MAILIPAWVDGELTRVEKLAAHQMGLRHMAVSVFILDGQKMLLQQRALGKYHTPGLWANSCCTHPEWNEDPAICAARRLDEELGVTGLTLEHGPQLEYRADVGDGLIEHEVVDVFLAQATTDLELRLNPDEVMATDWVNLHDLQQSIQNTPQKFTPWLRIYMAEHAEKIFGPDLLNPTHLG